MLDYVGRASVLADLGDSKSTSGRLLSWVVATLVATPWYIPAVFAAVIIGAWLFFMFRFHQGSGQSESNVSTQERVRPERGPAVYVGRIVTGQASSLDDLYLEFAFNSFNPGDSPLRLKGIKGNITIGLLNESDDKFVGLQPPVVRLDTPAQFSSRIGVYGHYMAVFLQRAGSDDQRPACIRGYCYVRPLSA